MSAYFPVLILPFWGDPELNVRVRGGITALFLSRLGNPQIRFSVVARIRRNFELYEARFCARIF